jgi:hypothetical protein
MKIIAASILVLVIIAASATAVMSIQLQRTAAADSSPIYRPILTPVW